MGEFRDQSNIPHPRITLTFISPASGIELYIDLRPDGGMSLLADSGTAVIIPFHKLRALIDEAERVGRHYWGDDWGKKL